MHKFRIFVIVLSTVMFCIQLKIATMNLISPPTVDSSRKIDITEIRLPLITVCLTNKTDFEKLSELGYKDLHDFYKGKNSNSMTERSWGNHVNMTFDQILEEVYNVNKFDKIKLWEDNKISSKIVFLPGFGFCKEYTDFDHTKELFFTFKPTDKSTRMRIFITNKDYRSYFSPAFSSHTGSIINVGLEEHHYINVQVKIISSEPYAQDFNVAKSKNYENCVDQAIQFHVTNKVGCNPPWLSKYNRCNGTYENDFLDNATDFRKEYVEKLISLENTKIEEDCMGTVTTLFKIETRKIPSNMFTKLSYGKALIKFIQKVEVTEAVYNYSLFQYIIDVGSSLGLWLGLSMLGIYDFFTDAWHIIKNFRIKKRVCPYLGHYVCQYRCSIDFNLCMMIPVTNRYSLESVTTLESVLQSPRIKERIKTRITAISSEALKHTFNE